MDKRKLLDQLDSAFKTGAIGKVELMQYVKDGAITIKDARLIITTNGGVLKYEYAEKKL